MNYLQPRSAIQKKLAGLILDLDKLDPELALAELSEMAIVVEFHRTKYAVQQESSAYDEDVSASEEGSNTEEQSYSTQQADTADGTEESVDDSETSPPLPPRPHIPKPEIRPAQSFLTLLPMRYSDECPVTLDLLCEKHILGGFDATVNSINTRLTRYRDKGWVTWEKRSPRRCITQAGIEELDRLSNDLSPEVRSWLIAVAKHK